MRTGLLKDMHPFTKFIFLILIALLSFFIVSFIGALIPIFILHISLDELLSSLQNPPIEENIPLLKYFQILQSIGLFIIPAVILAKVFFEKGTGIFGYRDRISVVSFWWAIVLMVFGFPLVNFLSEWNSEINLPGFLSSLENTMKSLEENATQIVNAFLRTKTLAGLFVNVVMIAMLPALGEELFFRGIVQRIFIDWTRNPWIGIFLGAFLFSFIHLQFYGFFPRLYLGFIFGLIYYWSGSIWLPVLAHFINNAAAVFLIFIYGQETIGKDVDTIGTQESAWYYLIISISFVCVALWQIYDGNKSDEASI